MNSVLIVDDEEVDFLIHSKIIKKGNFAEKIVYKSSGTSALEYLKSLIKLGEVLPTHIFVDINMPDMDGFQFLEEYSKLQGIEQYSPAVYILSSSDSSYDKSKAKDIPLITDYIVKPLTLEIAKEIFASH